ncbi:MAG: metal ABC transporter permease, partial [Thiobacillus sp.]|nr:metal ABC transporter permease [Thiobacillus sp.]
MPLAALDPALLVPPLAAGLLVLATHIPLGRRVLARGIVFLDLAIAQFAGLGVIIAHVAGWEASWATQLVAFAAALAGATLLAWSDRRWPARQEALIGSSFVVVACVAALLLASDPHGGEELQALLVGQILWVTPSQLAAAAAVYALVGALWRPLARHGFGFYALFALAITTSVQLVGVYLVFASLILPALATLGRERGWAPLAFAVGATGYASGL